MVRYTLFLLFITVHLQAQKIDEQLLEQAKALNLAHKKAEVVALHSYSTYNFFIDRKSERLYASHEEDLQYLALRSNRTFIKRNFYNDKSYIDDYSLESDRGRKYDHDKLCGHYQSGDIFYSDAQLCAYKFYMGMQGQGVNFQSKTIFTDPRYLTKIFFQDDIPVKERKVVINVPNWAEVELREMNFEGYAIDKVVSRGENTTYTYTIKDLEAMPDDNNAPGFLHFLPHILVLTKSYQHNAAKIPVLGSTDDLYSWYHTLTSSLGHKTEQIEAKVTELIAELNSDVEKIEAIYYWVQDNIKYIAFEDGLAGFKPEEADKVFYNRYGDCKGMANLTKTMLKLAGFDARLTWIGTNAIPYTYDIPSLAVDNHMICTVYAQGKQFILDATEKYNPLGHHAERIQGKQILIEDGSGYTIDTVGAVAIEKYVRESRWNFKMDDGYLAGKGQLKFNGEQKKNVLNYLHNLTGEDVDKFLQAVVSGSSNPDNFSILNYSKLSRKEPLSIAYNMRLDNQINSFGNEIYLDMDFAKEFRNLKLEDERKIPYSFGKRSFRHTVAEMVVPKGYKVNYLPQPYHFENEYFKFDLKYELDEGKIIYTKEIKILAHTLPVSLFEAWNTSVTDLTKFYNDQIILTADE